MLEARNCGWVTLSQDEQASWQALETKLCIRKVPDVPVQACLLPSLKSPSEKAKGECTFDGRQKEKEKEKERPIH
tara:strand:- start:674 stop:898 length:225 start_codon:yes stop_codon:yes gene_type:complete